MTNTAVLDQPSEFALWPAYDCSQGDNSRKHKHGLTSELTTVQYVRICSRDDSWDDIVFRTIIPQPNVLSELQRIVRRNLGYRSARRLKKLTSYEAGWDGCDSKTASPYSANLLAAFLTTYEKFPTNPSIFLTHNGYLELSWEDRKGQLVSVVFEDEACKVKTGNLDGEFSVDGPYDIQKVAQALPK